jgi:hypothetical protein
MCDHRVPVRARQHWLLLLLPLTGEFLTVSRSVVYLLLLLAKTASSSRILSAGRPECNSSSNARPTMSQMVMTIAVVLYVLLHGLLLPACCSAAFTARIHSRTDSTGASLIQAFQNDEITRLVIIPDRLDLATELEGLPARFRLNRCGAVGSPSTVMGPGVNWRLQLLPLLSITWV